jgi:hypothetical protein
VDGWVGGQHANNPTCAHKLTINEFQNCIHVVNNNNNNNDNNNNASYDDSFYQRPDVMQSNHSKHEAKNKNKNNNDNNNTSHDDSFYQPRATTATTAATTTTTHRCDAVEPKARRVEMLLEVVLAGLTDAVHVEVSFLQDVARDDEPAVAAPPAQHLRAVPVC